MGVAGHIVRLGGLDVARGPPVGQRCPGMLIYLLTYMIWLSLKVPTAALA